MDGIVRVNCGKPPSLGQIRMQMQFNIRTNHYNTVLTPPLFIEEVAAKPTEEF